MVCVCVNGPEWLHNGFRMVMSCFNIILKPFQDRPGPDFGLGGSKGIFYCFLIQRFLKAPLCSGCIATRAQALLAPGRRPRLTWARVGPFQASQSLLRQPFADFLVEAVGTFVYSYNGARLFIGQCLGVFSSCFGRYDYFANFADSHWSSQNVSPDFASAAIRRGASWQIPRSYFGHWTLRAAWPATSQFSHLLLMLSILKGFP